MRYRLIATGTQELMAEQVKTWKPHGRTVDAVCQDTPNLGSNKLDVILREAGMGGVLSIMAMVEMKPLPGGDIIGKEFSPEEMGQTLEFAQKILGKQPWRPHVFAVLSDTRRFKFFKVTRMKDKSFTYQYSAIFMDFHGWRLLALLVSQTNLSLGFVECKIQDWTLGSVLGVGGTAVVVEATRSSSSSSGSTDVSTVAKVYTGDRVQAENCRNREAAALEALKGIHQIPYVVPGAPPVSLGGQHVLLKSPRGMVPGDGVFPLFVDYLSLVDVVQSIHSKGWLHNDIAPANIFFVHSARTIKVFLNDFGSATRQGEVPHSIKSRALFYETSAASQTFVIGPECDLRALVLSIFVLTQKNAFDSDAVKTVDELQAIANRVQPWKRALTAAKDKNYHGVKTALKQDDF